MMVKYSHISCLRTEASSPTDDPCPIRSSSVHASTNIIVSTSPIQSKEQDRAANVTFNANVNSDTLAYWHPQSGCST